MSARAFDVVRSSATCANEFILLEHHPDRARVPAVRPGRLAVDDRCVALTWNVFRTLELVAPAFWLRRFRARLDRLTAIDPPATSLSVHLWVPLPDGCQPAPAAVDVVIETDTAVYGIMTFDGADVTPGDSTIASPDAVLRVIDAVSRHAGIRDCYVALLTSDRAHTPVGSALVERYRSSREMLVQRLPHRRDGLANLRGIGSLTWRDLAGIVEDCARSSSLSDVERVAADRTLRWLVSLGIHPSAENESR